jgi:hypothetical protein
MKKIVILIFLLSILSCTKKDTSTEEILEPDPVKRARAYADRGGGIFGDINNRKSFGDTIDFARTNVLWRATLKSLDFLPLINADYSGGIIIYDWYSQTNNPGEQIKVSVQFLSNELRSDSIKIIAQKKNCSTFDKCSNSAVDQKFSEIVKESIINNARLLKIEDTKKEKK